MSGRPVIAVGLGGTNGWFAIAWASDQAMATGGGLVLCHAAPPGSPLLDADVTSVASLETADPALARALAATRRRLGPSRVALRVAGVPAVELLLSTAAELVVVGPPGHHFPPRTGSTAHAVAGRSPVPVVVARRGTGRGHGTFAGHVVVGFGDERSRGALEFGFEQASLMGRPLAAVTVTDLGHDDYWFDDTMLSTHFAVQPAALERLAAEVEPWTHKYPEVPVKRAVFGGGPADGLVRASLGAALLVVGHPHRLAAARALLGSVPDRAVSAADAPVAVV